ncbi:hypothetical protein IWX49DRAFT_601042 [Phyllosticta citricarpa]|uniref:beta-glucosidase n=2 Tax=Phyllosticta TaxID=121621 RepID=A0ABR1M3S3_9PEZI
MVLSATYPSGPMAVGGKVIAQLYVSYPAAANQPVRQLRGFEKVPHDKDAKSTVTFEVRRKDVSHWDTAAKE